MKWEYTALRMVGDTANVSGAIESFNSRGREGWELVSVVPIAKSSESKTAEFPGQLVSSTHQHDFMFWFKRPLP